jgi:hypothetical protein
VGNTDGTSGSGGSSGGSVGGGSCGDKDMVGYSNGGVLILNCDSRLIP